jgi:aminoglycoside 6'-N-acetyltransferase I
MPAEGVRLAAPADLEELARMFHALWPEASVGEHTQELVQTLSGHFPGTMPLAVFVVGAENGALAGFIEVDLRSHADGCNPAVPVGYVEGWYVCPEYRRRGFGAQLMIAAEDWARAHGSVEMASDAWLSGDVSQTAHEALGFEVVDRCVHYRKSL